MEFAKGLFRSIVGAFFGVLSMIALMPAFAAFTASDAKERSPWMWLVALIGVVLSAYAPTIRRAFGRGFLLLGASVFALPLSMILFSGRMIIEVADPNTGAGVSTGIAGLLMTGASAFVGFFLGAILLIVGLALALGGRREVVIIDRTEAR